MFDEGGFSEDDTFLLSEFLAHTPPGILQKNMGWSRQVFDQLPPTHCTSSKLRFPGLSGMPPTGKTAGGETRVVDSANFPVALNIAAAMVTVKPGGLREMHWHPNVSEWQYWIKGKGRVTVVTTGAKARTMDINQNDVGFVPAMAGHSIENTGTEDLVFLEIFPHAGQNDRSAPEARGCGHPQCAAGQA